MRIERFIVQKYRAIDSVELSLKSGITPIIGVNESGKTTILHALQAFDKGRDVFNQSRNHLDYQNRYSTSNTRDCKIIAEVSLEQKEFDDIENNFTSKTSTVDRDLFRELRQNNGKFKFGRVLDRSENRDSRKYELIDSDLSDKSAKIVCQYLVGKIPVILYFDDFTDRVPEKIAFPAEYLDKGILNARGSTREWQELIREVFRRAQSDGIDIEGELSDPLRDFLKIKDPDRRDAILEDISDTLNEEIIKDWKSLKKSGRQNLVDDSTDLNLKLRITDLPDGSVEFGFRVIDRAKEGKKRPFPITDRSKGFQWFFNYMMKLKFNPRYKGEVENSIFLLDEPGSYLHSAAQSELLKELKSVSEKNTIIFCTHSQYLLDPKIIRLGAIRIARKQHGMVELIRFGEGGEKGSSAGALAPVYQALGLSIARDFVGKVLIVEGITDYCIFRLLVTHLDELRKIELNIVPAASASKVSALIGFAVGFASDFRVFLDRDDAGDEEYSRIGEGFGDHILSKTLQYGDACRKCRLEDLFTEEDQDYLCKKTGAQKTKKAIPLFFWDFPESHHEFISNLSKETWARLEPLIDELKRMQ